MTLHKNTLPFDEPERAKRVPWSAGLCTALVFSKTIDNHNVVDRLKGGAEPRTPGNSLCSFNMPQREVGFSLWFRGVMRGWRRGLEEDSIMVLFLLEEALEGEYRQKALFL